MTVQVGPLSPTARWATVAAGVAVLLIVAGAMLSVWTRVEKIKSDFPAYEFHLIRDFRFAFADVKALDDGLALLAAAKKRQDEAILGLLSERADLLYVRFRQFRGSPDVPQDGAFAVVLEHATTVQDGLDRLVAAGAPIDPTELAILRADSARLLASLGDFTRDVESTTSQRFHAQGGALSLLTLQVVGSLAVLTALAGVIFVLLVRHRRISAQITASLNHDGLTGLANRRGFAEWAQLAAQQPTCHVPHAIVVFDVDDFKPVNDHHGHRAGDALLKVAGAWLAEAFAGQGMVARWGGDEFVAALPIEGRSRSDTADWIAARLREGPTVEIAGEDLRVTFSCGAALWPDDGAEIAEVIQRADLALHEAKERGRGRLEIYRPEILERRNRVIEIRDGLRRALQNGDLDLHWQPQIDWAGRRVVCAEALLRWCDPRTGGQVMPGDFIPVAEASDLILDIDAWVLDRACRTAAGWAAGMAAPVRAAVNLSPRHFQRPSLVATVEAALRRSGLPADLLEVEITEGVFLIDNETVSENLAGLSRLGVRLALDDFGTGYSNIAYLTRLRPNVLKVDRSFLREKEIGTRNAIVRSMLRLADALGAETLAEGVETTAELRFLSGVGCRLVQGYLFARPMPAAEFPDWKQRFESLPDSIAPGARLGAPG